MSRFTLPPEDVLRAREKAVLDHVADEDERLGTERIYLDQLTILQQLIGGLDERNPKDLLTLVRAVVGLLRSAGSAPDPRLLATTPPVLDD